MRLRRMRFARVTPLRDCWRRGLSTALHWLISPAVLGALCVCFAFLLVVAAGQRARYRREAGRLKEEWLRYRKEMQAKVLPYARRLEQALGMKPEDAERLAGASYWQRVAGSGFAMEQPQVADLIRRVVSPSTSFVHNFKPSLFLSPAQARPYSPEALPCLVQVVVARQFNNSGASTPISGSFSVAHVLPKSNLGSALRPHSADASLRVTAAVRPADAPGSLAPHPITVQPASGTTVHPQSPGAINVGGPTWWPPLRVESSSPHPLLAAHGPGVQESSASAPGSPLRSVMLVQQWAAQTPVAQAPPCGGLRRQP